MTLQLRNVARRPSRHLVSNWGQHMRELADATRTLVRQHARRHLARSGKRVLCPHCRAAARAVDQVEMHLAGDYLT